VRLIPGSRTRLLALASLCVCGALAACSSSTTRTSSGASDRYDPRWGVSSSPRVATHDGPMPKGGGYYKVGRPYSVAGRWYTPREQPGYDARGVASWYGDDFHGRKTANGEIYDMNALTAAHPTLPMPSYVYVTNLDNGRTVLVRVNDRGPYVGNRIIDLSRAVARSLGYEGRGLSNVRVRYAGQAPLDGDDSRERRFLVSQPWNGSAPAYASAAPRPAAPRQSYASDAYQPPRQRLPAPASSGGDAWSPYKHRSGLGAPSR
jgi:rare lipoprotein A